MAITSWEGKLLLPVEDTNDEELIYRALCYYSHNCLIRGRQLGFEKIELNHRDVPISMFERYVDHTHTHVVLVKVLGEAGEGSGQAA